MNNKLGYIAIGLFVILTAILLMIPKNTIAKSLGIKDPTGLGLNRKDNIGYYRALLLISGTVTIVVMLFIRYVVF
jgi:hypothetical protein